MPSIVVEFLLGLYLGLLTGIVPAMVAGGLGFLFKYITGVTLPGLGVVVLAVAIAGVSGGLLGLIDPDVAASPRLMVALVVVMMLSLYAHAQGDALGTRLPRRFSLRELGTRTLSGEVIFNVGGLGRVEVTPMGEIRDIDGYPPLGPELRATLSAETWTFPADIPIEELERRLEERLQATHELAAVEIEIDDRANARIAAAPPVGSLSRRVPDGQRAVSIEALVPTGVARGDRVRLVVSDATVEGTVVSARSGIAVPSQEASSVEAAPSVSAPQTTGGEGRITVAVDFDAVTTVLEHDRARIRVLPRGHGLEHEVVRRLRAAGVRFRRLTVGAAGTDETVATLESTGAAVLAIRHRDAPDDLSPDWSFAPPRSTTLAAGDEVIIAGTAEANTRVEGRLA